MKLAFGQTQKTLPRERFLFGAGWMALACGLLAAAWLMPLHFLPWVSWHSELLAFLAVLLLGARGWWGLRQRAGVRDGRWLCGLPAVSWLLLALLVVVVGQTAVGKITFLGDGLVLSLYLVAGLVVAQLGAAAASAGSSPQTGPMPNALAWLAWTVVLGALASTVLAWAQVLALWADVEWINRMPYLRRPGANLGQPNHLATLVVMGMGGLLFLWESRRVGWLIAALLYPVLASGLAISESRAGLLSLLALAVLWCAGWRWGKFRLGAGWLCLGLLVALLAFALWPMMFSALQVYGQGADAPSVLRPAGLRWVVWQQLWQAVLLHPWVGWGLREVSVAHNAVAHAYPVSEPYIYSHNIVLDSALGLGLPLTALGLAGLCAWGWSRASAVRQLPTWFCTALVVPVAVHSLLEFPYAYAYFLFPVLFGLGYIDGAQRKASMPTALSTWGGLWALAWLLAVGGATVLEYVAIEEDFRVARFESLRVGATAADYERPKITLLTQLGAVLEATRIQPRPDMDAPTLTLLRQVALRFPWPVTQNRYALALALNGQPEEAQRQLRVMRAQYDARMWAGIQARWQELAQGPYPQLQSINMPDGPDPDPCCPTSPGRY